MKTVTELKQDISDIKYQIQNEDMKPAAEKRLRKRIPFLNMCIAYIESNPDPAFVKGELVKVQAKIDLRMNMFSLAGIDEMDRPSVTKLRKAHEKTYEVPHLREQVKALKFLLKK